MTVVDAVGGLLVWLSCKLFGAPCEKSLDSVRSILLIQLDHLGDAVLSTAMLPAIRERWPQAHLAVLAAPWNRAVFDHSPDVDAVHTWSWNRFRRPVAWLWPVALLYWSWQMRRRRFDLAIDVRGELPHALLMWLAGIKRRVGWPAGGGGFLLTDKVDYVSDRHEFDSRRALLQQVGIAIDPSSQFQPTFAPNSHESRTVERKLLEQLPGQQPLVVLHIGAGTLAKRWPLNHYRELLGRLIVELNLRVVLVGSSNERPWTRQITEGRSWPQVADWTGQLTLGELGALCHRATVFVGADSGPAHLTAAVDAPVVVLFSGTNRAQQWRPIGKTVRVVRHEVACSPCHRQRCPLADHPCMSGIAPREVIAEIRAILDRSPHSPSEGDHHTACDIYGENVYRGANP